MQLIYKALNLSKYQSDLLNPHKYKMDDSS